MKKIIRIFCIFSALLFGLLSTSNAQTQAVKNNPHKDVVHEKTLKQIKKTSKSLSKKTIQTVKTTKKQVKTPLAITGKKTQSVEPEEPLQNSDTTKSEQQKKLKTETPPTTQDIQEQSKESVQKKDEGADMEKKTPKIKELIKIRPLIKAEKVTPLQADPQPSGNTGNAWTDTYQDQDQTMRDYYRDHPGSYSPPLLKYDLPSGIY